MSFRGEFVFDDSINIVTNAHLRGLWPLSRFLEESRPVVDFTLALNIALGGLATGGFHLVNVAVHLVAGLTLFGIARRTLLTPRLTSRFSSRASAVAFVMALLWIIHPLQTQGITYIIQRAESMMAMFYLLTLYCVIRSDSSRHAAAWAVGAVLACAAGMGSKAVMATAPVVVFLYDAIFLSGSAWPAVRRRWGFYVALLATSLILFRVGVIAGLFGKDQVQPISVGFGLSAVSPWEYARTQPAVILHYLRLCFWPWPLCLDYGWPISVGINEILWPTLAIAGLVLATIWGTWKRPGVGFLGAAFLLILSPTSSFIPIKDLAFEHRMYLPSAAVIALVVVLADRVIAWAARRARWRPESERRLKASLVFVAAVVLGGLTIKRNGMYANPVELWRQNVAITPNHPRPHNAYGYELLKAGEHDVALREFQRAIELDANYAGAFGNIGNLFMVRRNYPEAIRYYRKALEISRYEFNADFHNQLGMALMETGHLAEAIPALEESVGLDPKYAAAQYNLGNAYLASGQQAKAIASYEAALRQKSQWDAEANVNLGLARAAVGQSDEAMQAYRSGARLADIQKKADVAFKARFNLGSLLLRLGRREEAAGELREALRINPQHPGGQAALREAMAGG